MKLLTGFVGIVAALLIGMPTLAQSTRRARPTSSASQKEQSISKQRRVTVKLKDGSHVTGNLILANPGAIQLDVAGNRLTLKWEDVESLSEASQAIPPPPSKDTVVLERKEDPFPAPTPSPTPEAPADLKGTWQIVLTGPTGQSMPGVLEVAPQGTYLSGILQFGDQRSTPSVIIAADNSFTVSFTSMEQGQMQTMTISGTVTGEQMKGSAVMAGATITFTGTRKSNIASIHDSVNIGSGVLTIQAGIVYRRGGAEAVARVLFYLLRKDLVQILQEAGLQPDRNMNLLQTFAFATRYQSTNAKYREFYQTAAAAIQRYIVTSTNTGFDGVAQFSAVPAGSYYVMGYTQTRGGFALWNVPVGIPTGVSTLILDQNNAAIAL